MSIHNLFIYILIMILITNLIRVIPITIIRGKIQNKFVKSFLFYVPYVTLAVMTFPAIIEATNSPIAGAVALLIGIIAAWFGLGLFPVAIISCAVVFVLELILLPM